MYLGFGEELNLHVHILCFSVGEKDRKSENMFWKLQSKPIDEKKSWAMNSHTYNYGSTAVRGMRFWR